jgi:hypothetical protein
MREVLIGLIFLGIAIAIIVGVLWVSFSYLPEREDHNARPTPPAAIWSSGFMTAPATAGKKFHCLSSAANDLCLFQTAHFWWGRGPAFAAT